MAVAERPPPPRQAVDKRRYFTKRILNALLTIVLVASFNFVLFNILPGVTRHGSCCRRGAFRRT